MLVVIEVVVVRERRSSHLGEKTETENNAETI